MKPANDRCRVCGATLELGEGWWRCPRIGHPAGASLPSVGMGELFGRRGRPPGRLADNKGHGLIRGWRDSYLQF